MTFISSTKRIVGCSTVSRKEHICAQTREVACTKIVLPEVIDKGMYNNYYLCTLCIVMLCSLLAHGL